MASAPEEYSDRQRRLGQIVFEYLERLERGEHPCPRRWIATHREFAQELVKFLEDRDWIEGAVGPVRRKCSCVGPQSGPVLMETVTLPVEGAPGGASTSFRGVAGYELLEELGRGGMGVVYRARQASPPRVVALKMLRQDMMPSVEDIQRFCREADAVASLDHPNIVPIYEVGRHEGRLFYTMKFIEGGGLDRQLAHFQSDVRGAVRLIHAVTKAVCHAHQQGLVHRDIKPSNILLDHGGQPYLTDFGLSRHVQEDLHLTRTGQLLGTPMYVAPEQITHREGMLTTRADIYGLGAVLYTLLAGRPPFEGQDACELLERVRKTEPVPPRRINPRVDRDLETICLKCLEKDPARRYACAGELVEDLERWQAGRPVQARRISRWERARRWCGRSPLVAGLAATIIVLLLGVIVLLSVHQHRVARYQHLVEGHLYAANIRLAQIGWNNSELAETLNLLEATQPAPGHPDLRGFEWYYLARLTCTELCTLAGHRGDVYAVAFAPAGTVLASAGRDGTVRVWEVASGRMLHHLEGHGDEVNTVAFSPEGTRLASGSDDGTIRRWDVGSGMSAGPPLSAGGPVVALAFSADGRFLASAGRGGIVQLWKASGGTLLANRKGHTSDVDSIAFAPDGKTLASAGRDHMVRLWEASTLEPRGVLGHHHRSVRAVAFSPDGQWIGTGAEDGTVALAKVAGELCFQAPGHQGWVLSLAFSPDGENLVSAGKGGTVRVWEVPSGKARAVLRAAHAERVWSVQFSPEGRLLATSGADGLIKLWDVSAIHRQERVTLAASGSVDSLAFHPEGRYLALARNGVFDATDGSVTATFAPADQVQCVAYSPDGGTLASGAYDGTVGLREPAGGEVREVLGRHAHQVTSIAFSPDGRMLATLSDEPTVWLWDPAVAGPPRALAGHEVTARALAFSPRGDLLATGDTHYVIHLWEPRTGLRRGTLRSRPTRLDALAFAPDGAVLASGGDDRLVRLWDVASGRETGRLLGHATAVWALAFSPDGRRLASGGEDGTVKIWDVATQRELLSLRGPGGGGGVRCLAFSPDGTALAAAGDVSPHDPRPACVWLAPRF